ncbi:NADH:flavin oxidoreductase [Alkalicoccus saliphilus]|uniref:NADH:flavin oxidoreductase n=1 Tax=Alkalicoccus saliphilus TaxID=200989 RepID=A0A2T4U6R5_9BACI|nr:NADH:flavin oxidoreductase [Alkalicoccus saliphilus]PTL39079.1 NADH:flavin oxidoreductase [Alkalicoccus saliphilus]
MNQKVLFTPSQIKNKTLANRFVVAPMTRISAERDGQANETMQHYYERYAKCGYSAVISEGIYLDESYSQGYNNQPGLANDAHTEAWKPVVRAVQDNGSLMIAQLMHAGGQSQGNIYTGETIAPSSAAPKGEQLSFYGGSGPFQTPKAAEMEDLQQIKAAFVQSALRAKEAGFDGVELHGANGYLLDQFLTDYLNDRKDAYGGSIENRLRLILEIIEEVREVVGESYIIGIRMSQIKVTDSEHKWAGGEKDAKIIFSALGNTSLNYVHVTDGDGSAPAFGENSRTLADAAKTYGKLQVIANGGLGTPEKAAAVIENNEADFVSLGTSALANPDLPNRVEKEKHLQEFDFENTLLPQAEIKEHELNQTIVK